MQTNDTQSIYTILYFSCSFKRRPEFQKIKFNKCYEFIECIIAFSKLVEMSHAWIMNVNEFHHTRVEFLIQLNTTTCKLQCKIFIGKEVLQNFYVYEHAMH